MDPSGRVVVVTGAAGGIGGALVRALVDAGAAAVVGADLVAPAHLPAGAQARALDVSDEAATIGLIDEVESAHGPIEMWFANAGTTGGSGPESPDEVWEREWRVNVMAHVYAARTLVPRWLDRGGGHLITTASAAGLLTTLGEGVYSTTKHAAVGWAEWLAITYGDQGIRVSCVCPGAVDTAMLRAAAGDAATSASAIGGGEALSADDAAAAILAGTIEDRFLILTHPELQEFVIRKAQDPERWIRGMRRLWSRSREVLPGPSSGGSGI